ncbi:protein of unknown function [Nitrospina watsonii]|uniref:Uncharacterized protein n=1 Tax=Nitrospina watsonii TaxID=1323948 RepID=A0ABM9HC08_9BACT|nr:protein of unknown function [Nitrospina watsonii]
MDPGEYSKNAAKPEQLSKDLYQIHQNPNLESYLEFQQTSTISEYVFAEHLLLQLSLNKSFAEASIFSYYTHEAANILQNFQKKIFLETLKHLLIYLKFLLKHVPNHAQSLTVYLEKYSVFLQVHLA